MRNESWIVVGVTKRPRVGRFVYEFVDSRQVAAENPNPQPIFVMPEAVRKYDYVIVAEGSYVEKARWFLDR